MKNPADNEEQDEEDWVMERIKHVQGLDDENMVRIVGSYEAHFNFETAGQ